MATVLELPDDLRQRLIPVGQEPARAAEEALSLETYRAGRLSQSPLQRLLGFGTRKRHAGWLEYSMEDFHREA